MISCVCVCVFVVVDVSIRLRINWIGFPPPVCSSLVVAESLLFPPLRPSLWPRPGNVNVVGVDRVTALSLTTFSAHKAGTSTSLKNSSAKGSSSTVRDKKSATQLNSPARWATSSWYCWRRRDHLASFPAVAWSNQSKLW
eukprot:GHVQ01042611.1.p1 GENE.GHVQ01042611.1~~GHVQ01042611.1.p1  ORF type:complete len:140 (-),score=13.07 GHVQ01042611.1:724-1143(-)